MKREQDREQEMQQEFLDAVKSGLDQAHDELDDLTVMRLRQMRNKALQAIPASTTPAANVISLREQWWMPLTGVAATIVIAALAFHMTTQAPQQQDDILSAMEDMQILGAEPELDFYQDLEFYQWLDEQKDLG